MAHTLEAEFPIDPEVQSTLFEVFQKHDFFPDQSHVYPVVEGKIVPTTVLRIRAQQHRTEQLMALAADLRGANVKLNGTYIASNPFVIDAEAPFDQHPVETDHPQDLVESIPTEPEPEPDIIAPFLEPK